MFSIVLVMTTKRIIGKIGIININSLDVPINKIDNIAIKKDLVGLIFNYGTIIINSTSGKISFKAIANPDVFKKEVFLEINKC
jgi:hypothetical protein